MNPLGKLLNLLCLALFGLWTVVSAFLVVGGSYISEHWAHTFHRLWALGACLIMGVDVVPIGLEHWPTDRAVVVAPNHESLWDILVMASLPVSFHWLAKAELARVPFIGRAMKKLGAYFVSRDRSGKDLNVMRVVEDGLRAGRSVVIFPEGTRTRTGELLPFKKGAFRTAANAGVELMPVAITGTFSLAAPGEIPAKRGQRVVVRFGRPYAVSRERELGDVMADYRQKLVALLGQDRNMTQKAMI